MHAKFLVPLAAIALSACASSTGSAGTSPELAPPPPDECQASKLGRYLNVLPTDDIKAAIAAEVGQDRRIRYIAPGQAITLDYLVFRLNVETGKDGRIKRFYCG